MTVPLVFLKLQLGIRICLSLVFTNNEYEMSCELETTYVKTSASDNLTP